MLFHSNIYNIDKLFNISFEVDGSSGLSNKEVYNIPFYQREYVWTSIQSEKLLTDVFTAFNNRAPQYFLGGIVLNAMTISDEQKFIDIVDGQQRTITLSIILAVLYNFLQKNKQLFIETSGIPESNINAVYSDKFEKLKTLVVKHESTLDEGTKSFFKLNTNKHICEFYENFINYMLLPSSGNYNNIEEYTSSANGVDIKTDKNIIDVGISSYKFFSENLNNIRVLEKFVPYLLEKILLVTTITDDLKTAFQIFETLNDRGIGLSPDDLIKSFLIKNVTVNYEKYSDLWDEFLENLRDEKGKFITKPLDFFDQLFLSEGTIIPEDKVFDYFNETYSQENNLDSDSNIEDFLKKLKKLSKYHIETKQNQVNLDKLNIDNSYATLISLYPIKDKSEQVQKFVKHIERIAVVYFFNGHTKNVKNDLSKLNKIIHDGLSGINPNNIDKKIRITYKQYIKQVNKFIKDRSEGFEDSLIKMYIPKSGKRYTQIKYILSVLAYKLGGAQFNISSGETTIEHLMPQDKPNSCYNHVPDEKYQVYNKRIGNLTIMNKDLNQLLGNDCSEEKFKVIEEQHPDYFTYSIIDSNYTGNTPPYGLYKEKYNYNKISNDKIWNLEEIDNRSHAIARLSTYIWVEGHI